MSKFEEYIGTISKIIDKDLYLIEVDIPGYQVGLKAFPRRGEVDEPRVGDVVILKEFDPTYRSYYLYEKLKENNFIGIRSRGKVVKMNQDEIVIGIFDPEAEWNDKDATDSTPESSSWIKIDKSGNIDINAEGNQNIVIAGDSKVKISGNSDLEVSGNINIKSDGDTKIVTSGNTNIESSGNATIKSPKVTVTGGQLVTKGTANTDNAGPYNCIPICPFSGAPHRGSQVSGT